VNCIPPGRIMSAQIRRNYPEDYRNQFAETEIPVKFWGEREDLAVMAVWLASPLARYRRGHSGRRRAASPRVLKPASSEAGQFSGP
jgi:NAD(P)-dependent dehydrogenase (short-subunit alcohol dehydrogenase family)